MHYDCTKEYSQMEIIEIEGRKVTSKRDPPGQKSVYIPPGNPERETYRLSTFHHYPRNSPIDPREFAAHGLYYTGYRDRVKCFSCGQCSDNWMLGDDVTSPEWHELDCDFINRKDTTNIPILAFLRQRRSAVNNGQSSSINRSTTSSNQEQPSSIRLTAGEVLPSSTAPKRPLAFNLTHNARQTARFSNLTGSPCGNAPIIPPVSPNVSSPTIQRRSPSENHRDLFPCLHPINPHMRTEEARLQTFLDNSSIWPAHRIRATPQQIVDAGMYYLGERDRVKCWYCNGGLQNWERDDNPWEEHAKWFPLCEYVLKQKGPNYVHEIVARFPGLRRPTLYNPSSAQAAQSLIRLLNLRSNERVRIPPQNGITSQPVIVDPRQEINEQTRKIAEEMRSSDDVAQARMMGFDDDVIERVLKRKYELSNQSFANFHDLIEAILSVSETADSTESRGNPSGESQPSTSASLLSLYPAQEVKKLEESRRCKKCYREDAYMVFLPCGHLACCVKCSEKVKKCPICKAMISEKMRSYIA